jgi:thioredoxin:protein disulfide reductase
MLTCVIVFLFSCSSPPAFPHGEENVSASAKLSQDGLHPGEEFRCALVVSVKKGWHINSASPSDENLIATSATFLPPPGLAVADLTYPRGTARKFAFSDAPLDVYEGTFVILLRISAAGEMKPGSYPLPVDISYQACNNDICLPPASVHLVIDVRVLERDIPAVPANREIFGAPPDR